MPGRAFRIVGRVIAVTCCCLSLAVCAAAAILWVRGYHTVDVFEADDHASRNGDTTRTVYRLSSGRGAIVFGYAYRFSHWRPWPPGRSPPPNFQWRSYVHSTMRPDQFKLLRRTIWQTLGFSRHSREHARHEPDGRLVFRNVDRAFRTPYWLVVPVTAVGPVLYVRRLGRLRRRFRSRRGLCPGCGYDVRATPERCPECGEAIAATKAPLPVALGAVP